MTGWMIARTAIGAFGLFIGLLFTPHIVGSIRLGRDVDVPTVIWWAGGWTAAIVTWVMP